MKVRLSQWNAAGTEGTVRKSNVLRLPLELVQPCPMIVEAGRIQQRFYLTSEPREAEMLAWAGMGRHGQGGGHLPNGNVEKCFLLQMLSKTSLDEVFMHHFEKMSSASGGLAPRPPPGELPLDPAGDFRPSDSPHCPPLEKILRAPMAMYSVVIALAFLETPRRRNKRTEHI